MHLLNTVLKKSVLTITQPLEKTVQQFIFISLRFIKIIKLDLFKLSKTAGVLFFNKNRLPTRVRLVRPLFKSETIVEGWCA